MKKIALYLRLSHADNDLGKDNKDESNSIENQRSLLRDFVERNEDLNDEIEEYVDDGFTGTNFNRPGFMRLIEDSKKGGIGTIIVKDLSRLGRDYIGVGDYIEQIFPELGIRVIAINSNYDSINYTGNTVGVDINIQNLINSLYSKDLSKKVRSGKIAKWKNGQTTSEQMPFGYIRNPIDSKKWLIDKDAASIVRLIFEKANEGWGTRQITELLNEKEIPTPSKYFEMNNRKEFKGVRVKSNENLWDLGKVWRVITNYAYTGNVVHGKKTRIIVGSRESRKVQEKDRFIIKNAIPQIVTEKEYENAQLVLKRHGTDNKGNDLGYALTKKVKCGNCNLSMTYKERDGLRLFCRHAAYTGESSTCPHCDFPASIIENQVFKTIKQQLEVLTNLGDELSGKSNAKSISLKDNAKMLESRREYLNAEKIRQYESYASGFITQELFVANNTKITSELSNLNNKIKEMETDIDSSNSILFEINKILNKAEDCVGKSNKLTRHIANVFVDTAYVHDLYTIEVKLKFDDLIAKANEKLTT